MLRDTGLEPARLFYPWTGHRHPHLSEHIAEGEACVGWKLFTYGGHSFDKQSLLISLLVSTGRNPINTGWNRVSVTGKLSGKERGNLRVLEKVAELFPFLRLECRFFCNLGTHAKAPLSTSKFIVSRNPKIGVSTDNRERNDWWKDELAKASNGGR